ncbi:ABC transporter substrate-binding protein [Candidatus Woesearchaeota archaeon]|jgi:branched-chain amino acid transport system substrate-binding protein|nr:ABC transporter substrate-binding protein [Candidatus Woesearchaeota archaeon]MBT4367983.1 ABC transporter substrate-binding protein [Candidatus Woesearchaeota archaeon]MBT4712471.1 ABC transporter substrate-binding protein [Candidatus Woesearchaeota archaeon]MBT6639384.1 ABC transporter substrate-binding protein [Candidatus Woesearchaeota archaeon]MBT7133556.1 ABC transporter substrate-binding protein [Candidatus Woesearchaeota archaeon]
MKYVLLGLILLCLVGCTTGNVVKDETLDVALVIPITGIGAAVGQDFLYGIELAKEELNLQGVEFHIEDTRTDPKEAVTATTSLLNTEDIDVIVTLQAQVSQPLLTLADQHDIPLIASLTSLVKEDYTRKSENAFLQYPLPEEEMALTLKFMEQEEYETVALLTVLDEFGNTMTELLNGDFEGEVVLKEEFQKSDLDYRTQLTKIKKMNPDAIYVIGYPPHLINFLKQRKELGIDIPVVSTMHIQSDFVRKKSVGLMDKVYAITPVALVKGRSDFGERFENKFSVEPDFLAPFGYDLVLVLDQIKNQDAKTGLYDIEIEGINGHISFNDFGEVEMPLVVVEADDRELIMN